MRWIVAMNVLRNESWIVEASSKEEAKDKADKMEVENEIYGDVIHWEACDAFELQE
jgi:hypothetical protein